MSEVSPIEGECHPRFRAVRDAFEASFAAGLEVGAAVAVSHDGEPVVDLWGGHADQARTRSWKRDTLANVFSTTKGMTALCAHRLVDQGRLDLDAPAASYWPDFAKSGKEGLRVRWLLDHRAGLAALRDPLPPEALYDWERMTQALAEETPWWTPGECHGYHAITFGWLVGEVVRRVAGRSLGTYFREEIAEPLGVDFHIGLPESEHARVAELSEIPMGDTPDCSDLARILIQDPGGIAARALLNPPSLAAGPNHAAWRSAEIPGANGHGTARAIARMYGALARGGELDGVRVLDTAGVERCRSEQTRGLDAVLGVPTRFGLGFMLSQDETTSFGPSPDAFGHPGAGGSVGFADPQSRIGFGYAMNRLGPNLLTDPRPAALIQAVYQSLS